MAQQQKHSRLEMSIDISMLSDEQIKDLEQRLAAVVTNPSQPPGSASRSAAPLTPTPIVMHQQY